MEELAAMTRSPVYKVHIKWKSYAPVMMMPGEQQITFNPGNFDNNHSGTMGILT